MNFKTLTLLLLAFSVCISSTVFAQKKGKSKIHLQQQMQQVEITQNDLTINNFFVEKATEMGLNNAIEMQLVKTINGVNGHMHYRYQQQFQSVPVFGSAYTLHTKNEIVQRASGYYLPLIDLDVRPSISAEKAIHIAMDKMNAKTYAFEQPQGVLPTKRPEAILYIVGQKYPKPSEYYTLAYAVELSAITPLDKRQYFVDAHSGKVLFDLPLLLHSAVPAQGETKYYGTQSITVDSIAPDEFVLRDPSRNGNTTFNSNLELWTSEDNSWNLMNADQDEVAIDAHFCTQEFYDFMLETFNWNGLDNNGLAMNIVVHAGDFVNAFWNGDYAAFGDGDCNHGPLTTLEVIAHEFMHGITDYTSDLVYSDESGAINESMSDIFGKALEYSVEPNNFDWLLGHSFLLTPYVESFRSFAAPNDRGHPKFYKGEYWFDGGGVHTNSSVGNHWFYNLVEGGEGLNEIGEPYNVEGLGMDKAIQIVFHTQRTYLTPNSTYQFYYESSIQSAKEIYGENAPEVNSVMEAWKVVGLPFQTATNVFDLATSVPNTFVDLCLINDSYDIEVTVSNLGNLPYLPTMMGSVEVSYDTVELTIPLEEEIIPGESVVVIFEDAMTFDGEANTFYNAELILTDDNNSNDRQFAFIENKIHEDNDMAVFMNNLDLPNCYNDSRMMEIRIENNSCSILPEGTPFEIQLENLTSGTVWSENYMTTQELGSGNGYQISEEVDLISDNEYNLKLVYSTDVNPDNNIDSLGSMPTQEVITFAYDNNFDSDDGHLVFDGRFSDYELKDYQGNNVMAISSSFSQPFNSLCPDPESNLAGGNISPIGTLFFCADLENMVEPKFGFDLTQFRNQDDIDFPELYDQSNLLEVSWISETASASQIIFGQEEGELIHHDINLPDQFKGKIQLKFYHHTGRLFNQNYLDYDVSLLDNLTITSNTTSTRNLLEEKLIIYPNPSNHLFRLTHPAQPEYLVIRNAQGQTLLQQKNTNDLNQIDLSKLPNGYYLLTVNYGEEGNVTKGVVKMGK